MLARSARPARRHERGARRRVAAVGVGVAVALLALVSCGSSSAGSKPAASANPSPVPATPGAGKKFYVSIGDSYAAGYQPGKTKADGRTTTNGFAYQLTAEDEGRQLTLVNFGCAGATTASLLHQNGCSPSRLGPGGAGYPGKSQSQAAIAFVSAHRADVGLITVVIGGNDVTKCAKAKDVAGCLTAALKSVKTNLGSFLPALRAAAGPAVSIVGLTYPDVILGEYVSAKASEHGLAALSVTAFKSLLNPALQAQYQAVNATFIDVTAATGAYVPFSQTTTLAPYGTVPVAVAKVCQLTYFCQLQDIHPRTSGYQLIADLIAKALPAS